MNLGEVLGVAVNSKGRVMVLNHPGSATSGPLYGNATTQLLEFDENGKFVREVGRGVYGLAYAHSVRYDKCDNLWVVDKGTHTSDAFQSGRIRHAEPRDAGPRDRTSRTGIEATASHEASRRRRTWTDNFGRPPISPGTPTTTSTSAMATPTRAWRSSTSTGTGSSRGARAAAAVSTRTRTRASSTHRTTSASIGRTTFYVADRGNRRIQVFDRDGTFQRFIHLTAPYDKTRHPVLGNLAPNPPDETPPWTLCITNTPTQYLYTSDQEPGRIYKLTLDGRIVGMLGESGHEVGQFNWIHGIACPSERPAVCRRYEQLARAEAAAAAQPDEPDGEALNGSKAAGLPDRAWCLVPGSWRVHRFLVLECESLSRTSSAFSVG